MEIIDESSTKSRAVVGYDPVSNSIITSFRGSSNIKNWLEDFDVFKVDYNEHGCNDC